MKDPHAQTWVLKWPGYELHLGQRTRIMGVLNVTPDSFSDGGRFLDRDRAIEEGLALAREGADIIDVGGESTRPYSRRLSAAEEMGRVIPVIRALGKELQIPISIDTYKAEVARKALRAAASMINDISALRFDPDMGAVAAKAGVPVVLMHMQGTPGTMQDNPTYGDLMEEVGRFLGEAVERAVESGIGRDMILLDPGIGFGKTFEHNLQIIRDFNRFRQLGRPLLLGVSRKAFIGRILDREAPDRDIGTLAAVVLGVMNGAHIVRVHNVALAAQTLKVVDAVRRGKIESPKGGGR